tara:strand:- start:294844 stop:294984 length:141 start_codon:yes stop_codon:yes gene_type:complete
MTPTKAKHVPEMQHALFVANKRFPKKNLVRKIVCHTMKKWQRAKAI